MNWYKIAQNNLQRVLYHGTGSEKIEGPLMTNTNDPGWFGKGFYATAYLEHAKVYGKHVFEVTTTATKFAEIQIVGQYDKAIYIGDAEEADRIAGGTEKWLQNDSEWAKRFTDVLKSKGYEGIRVSMNGKPDAEVVIFDPSKVTIGYRIL